MCKNMMIAGLKTEVAEKDLWKFLVAAVPFMSANDKDGMGYAAIGKDGLFGERWLNPKDAFNYRTQFSKRDAEIEKEFQGALDGTKRYNKFGKVSDAFAVIFHSRMATCGVNLENTHPFVSSDGSTALIHNGVVNSQEVSNLSSTCDSELILNSYMGADVRINPNNIQTIGNQISGSYACGVLTKDSSGKDVLDIFRNDTNMLYAAYVKELDAIVYCTTSEIIRNTCKKLKWKHGSIFKVTAEKLIRIDAKTGKFMSQHEFEDRISFVSRVNSIGGSFVSRVTSIGGTSPFAHTSEGYRSEWGYGGWSEE